MFGDRLTALQREIIVSMAVEFPEATLVGGGALLLAYANHRTTRDLDYFWRDRDALGETPRNVRLHLETQGYHVHEMQRAWSFHRFRVEREAATVVVDLVADPPPPPDSPVDHLVSGVRVRIDTAQSLLAAKLCALLGRAEIRDLQDVRELLPLDVDLARAMREAASKDTGFSAMTLAWLLRDWKTVEAAVHDGIPMPEAQSLGTFRDVFVERLMEFHDPRG